MNSKTTWTCVAAAGTLFAFIFFFEQPFRKKLNASQSTKIFPTLDTNAVTSVEVRRPDQPTIQVARTNRLWVMTSPLVYPAAGPQIEKLLDALSKLDWQAQITAAELQNRPNAQEEFGFVNPTASLVAHDGKSGLNLLVGKNTPVGEQVYLEVVGGAGIYIVDAALLKLLPRSANDWRDRDVFRFTNSINTVKARSGNKSLTLIFTNGVWRFTAPQQARGDNLKINEQLRKTASLQVAKFETDDPNADLETYGLQTPEMEVSFAFDTNVFATLQIGRSPTNDPSQVFARLQNQNNIYRVARETLEPWRGSHTNLVDRHLIDLSLKGVAQIEVHGDDQFVLRREGKSWKLADSFFSVDSALVDEVLVFLGRAEVEIEKDVVTDFTAYGLNPPALEYTLLSPSNSVVAQIDFGTNQPGKVFVRRLDEYPDTVYSIPPLEYQRLPRASWQFRDRRVWSFTTNEVVSLTIQQNGKERKFIRNSKDGWSLAPGSQGIFDPFAFAEALYRLGELKAVFWVATNEQNLDRYGFKETDHRITLEIKRGDQTESLSLEFGGFSEFGTRYAATMISGARTVFEFPWPLFIEVQDSLTIPSK